MRPVLIDTNAYTAFKRGDSNILRVIEAADIIAMSPIVLGELLGGFSVGSKEARNREELQLFLQSPRVYIYPITVDTANFYSHVYAGLRKKGTPIPTNDLWIAAQALENGCLMCTFDKHFYTIEGLLVGTTLMELML